MISTPSLRPITLLTLVALASLTGCASKSDELNTALVHADDESSVQRLLAEGASPNAVDTSGTGLTALHIAATRGDIATAKLLIAAGAKIDAGKEGYKLPNATYTTGSWLWKSRENFFSFDQPLHLAVRMGHLDMVRLLLASGARVDAPTTRICSGQRPRDKAPVIDFGTRHDDNEHPIHIAAEAGNLAMINLLLESGAKVYEENQYGEQPLAVAAASGKFEAVKLLLSVGANINAAGKRGSALHLAVRNETQLPLDSLTVNGQSVGEQRGRHLMPSMIDFLLSAGASPESQDAQGNRPLHRAAECGSLKTIERLLNAGAVIDSTNASGDTPLINTVRFGRETPEKIAALKLLLKRGANPNHADLRGVTPLQHAAWARSAEPVITLLAAGANPNAADKFGTTALHFAAWMDNAEAVTALLTAGAKLEVRSAERFSSSSPNLTPLELAEELHKDKAAALLRAALAKKR